MMKLLMIYTMKDTVNEELYNKFIKKLVPILQEEKEKGNMIEQNHYANILEREHVMEMTWKSVEAWAAFFDGKAYQRLLPLWDQFYASYKVKMLRPIQAE